MIRYVSELSKTEQPILEIAPHATLILINDQLTQHLTLQVNTGATLIYTELFVRPLTAGIQRNIIVDDHAQVQLFFGIRAEADTKNIQINVQQAGFLSKVECYVLQKITRQGVTKIHYLGNQSAGQTSNTFMHRALVHDIGSTTVSGLMRIEQSANNAYAFQDSIALLDGAQARAHMTPILEIMCHEVSCKHGSAVGTIDEELLFYLLSRGISCEDAKKIILQSFLEEFFGKYCNKKEIYDYVRSHF